MFDTIGLDPDAEAGQREARSAAMTLILLGSTGAAMFIAGLLSAAEVVIAAHAAAPLSATRSVADLA